MRIAGVLGAGLILLGAGGCGVPLPGPAPAASGVVVRLTELPGFGPATGRAGLTPAYTLYADGRLISSRPAERSLVERQVDAGTVRALLRSAVFTMAGRDEEQVLDGGTLAITMVTSTGRVEGGVLGAGARAHRLLARFQAAAEGSTTVYEPRAVAAIGYPSGNSTAVARPWPVPQVPREELVAGRTVWCALLTGPALAQVRTALSEPASTWLVAGERVFVTFRPLLPEEVGCRSLPR
jgi:hypothetical protein